MLPSGFRRCGHLSFFNQFYFRTFQYETPCTKVDHSALHVGWGSSGVDVAVGKFNVASNLRIESCGKTTDLSLFFLDFGIFDSS